MKFIVLALLVAVVAEVTSYQRPHIILPTYRPPLSNHRPVIRIARSASRDEPQWLYEGDVPRAPATGDHPVLPKFIDDIRMDPNRRYARSLDSNAKRVGGSHTTSGGSRDTGPTHPGYNRRNTRSLKLPDLSPQFPRPSSPTFPKPFPGRQILPINSRFTRDLHFPGMKKPTYRDVIIPNWNPNVKTNPWSQIQPRRTRDVEAFDDEDVEKVFTFK